MKYTIYSVFFIISILFTTNLFSVDNNQTLTNETISISDKKNEINLETEVLSDLKTGGFSNINHEKNTKNGDNVSNIYKLLYEDSKSANNSIITILQWSIGLIFTIILAVIGSQIFFNFRINKKEIENIKKTNLEEIANKHSEILAFLNGKLSDQNGTIQLKTDDIRNEMLTFYDNKMSEISKQEETKKELLDKNLEILETKLRNEISYLEAKMNKNSGYIWELKGVTANALTNFLNTVESELDLNYDPKFTLDNILKVLKDLDDIHEMDYKRLVRLVQILPASTESIKNEITILFKDKPIYVFKDDGKISHKIYVEKST